jgi:hypothetical protein
MSRTFNIRIVDGPSRDELFSARDSVLGDNPATILFTVNAPLRTQFAASIREVENEGEGSKALIIKAFVWPYRGSQLLAQYTSILYNPDTRKGIIYKTTPRPR